MPTRSEVFQQANRTLREEDLISWDEWTKREDTSPEEINKLRARVQQMGLSTESVFFQNYFEHLTPLYYRDGVMVDLLPLELGQEYEPLKEFIDKLHQLVEEKQFTAALIRNYSAGAALAFQAWFDRVPEPDRYDFFVHAYANMEYDFAIFTEDIIEKVAASQGANARQEILERLPVHADGLVTVYRGMTSRSTPVNEALSWTLSKDTALFFSERFEDSGWVVEGQVSPDDVVLIHDGRGEAEVIIRRGKVRATKTVQTRVGIVEEMTALQEEGMDVIYQQYRDAIENMEHLYRHPEGVHGTLHVKRVLLHLLGMAMRDEEMTEEDLGLLVTACLIHDIGRTHDGEEPGHGEAGWQKALKNEELEHIIEELPLWEGDDEDIIHFIVATHDLPDGIREEWIQENTNWSEEKASHALYLSDVFKDADGLDRVRLGDLNTNYLRTAEAPARVLVAEAFYHSIT